jgi:hypothetical protein
MKILVAITASLVLFCQVAVAHTSSNQKDGIDKRITKAKLFLSKKLSVNEMNQLDFAEAVLHTRDSFVHYIKVPYKSNKKNGFMILKSSSGKLDCVNLEIMGYKRKDTVLKNYFPIVNLSYPLDKRATKTLVSNKWGFLDTVIIKNSRNYLMDSIYKVVSFFLPLSNSETKSLMIYLNVSLLFDNIDSLNNKAYHDGIIIQDVVQLAFNSSDCVDYEYSNSNVLPAIDLKEAFKHFDNKPDSIKKN